MTTQGTANEQTCFAVGCIKSLFTLVAVLVTVDENHPKPLVKAANGSFCSSSNLGRPSSCFAGAGVFPNPAYLPPWLGGRSSGLAAFAFPRPSKYLSSTLVFPTVGPPGLSDLLPPAVPLSGVADLGAAAAALFVGAAAGFLSPGTYSLPSTLALSLSFHSSPTVPL